MGGDKDEKRTSGVLESADRLDTKITSSWRQFLKGSKSEAKKEQAPARGTYRRASQPAEYTQAETRAYAWPTRREKSEISSRIENVDGADFKKNSRRLETATQEKGQPRRAQTQYAYEVTTQRVSSRTENEVLEKKKQENEIVGQVVYQSQSETSIFRASTNESESAATSQDSPRTQQVEKCTAEDLVPPIAYKVESAKPEDPPVLPREVVDEKATSPPIWSTPQADPNPFENIEPAQLGFVKYLFDKALAEIDNGNAEGAKPYIERLDSMEGAERVISALEDKIYSQKFSKAVSKLKPDDTSPAVQFIDGLEDPKHLKYKQMMQRELSDYLRRIAVQQIHSSEYSAAFRTISAIEGHEKTWGSSQSHVSPIDDLMNISGNHIKLIAISNIEEGRYTEALGLLYFLQDDHIDHKWAICITMAQSVLEGIGGNFREWDELLCVDRILDIPKSWPGVIPADVDLSQTVFNVSDSVNRATRKVIIDKVYGEHDRIDQNILNSRNAILHQMREDYKKAMYSELDRLSFEGAYLSLLDLEQFWDESGNPYDISSQASKYKADVSRVKIRPTLEMLIVGQFLTSRQRKFTINHDLTAQKRARSLPDTLPHGTSPDIEFVFYLTQAEVSYFEKRDIENSFFWCQKAIKINDKNIPHWASKSDALYLLARIFTRKNLPLDADYHYSLIPSFEKYDQWRIYGYPGKALREAKINVGIDRGNLIFSDGIQKIADALRGQLPNGVLNFPNSAIVKALYADDLSWSFEEVETPHPFAFDRPRVYRETLLHFLSISGPPEYLRIALHNPWVDVEEKSTYGHTPLHRAAKLFDKEKVLYLIKRGADIHSVNDNGDNILHYILNFPPKMTLSDADIKGTLGLLVRAYRFEQGRYGTPSQTYLLNTRNGLRRTPIDLLRSSLARELETPEAKTEPGYLKRFEDAWDVISKVTFCPTEYKDDPIFYKPAQREKEFRRAAERTLWKAAVARENEAEAAEKQSQRAGSEHMGSTSIRSTSPDPEKPIDTFLKRFRW
ncbi:hypothetical protein TWF281_000241 [Arthrobotrys megalospora]